MTEKGFDYGAEASSNAGFVQATAGPHSARVRSIIHIGKCKETYGKTIKAACNEVVFIFELKNQEDVDEAGKPIAVDKACPLKKGDKATIQKLRVALDPTAKTMGDLIGTCATVIMSPGKDLDSDGKPKYVNYDSIAAMQADFKEMVKPLTDVGVGHVLFKDITKEAIMELNPARHVRKLMMGAEDYPGSKAEQIVNEILAEDPDFGKAKVKEDDEAQEQQQEQAPPMDNPPPPCELDPSQQF